MRRSLYVAFVLVLVSGNTEARAEFVSYNFTGTIKTAFADLGGGPAPYAPGDHITWTLLYDRSTPLHDSSAYSTGTQSYYMTKYPVITDVVDQTNGYHFPWRAGGGGLLLYGASTQYPSYLSTGAGFATDQWTHGEYDLFLVYKESFPTANLSDWQLNGIPLNLPKSDFSYYVQSGMQPVMTFDASVDSMSGPIPGIPAAPEPGSLTLFLLGAAGLPARGLRRRLQAACLRRPLLTH